MTKYINVTYRSDEDPVAVLENAIKKHGREEAFMVMPEHLCRKWFPVKNKGGGTK